MDSAQRSERRWQPANGSSLIGKFVQEGPRKHWPPLATEDNAYIVRVGRSGEPERVAARSPQRLPPAPEGHYRSRRGRGQVPTVNDNRVDEATGERSGCPRDPATMVPRVAEDQSGAPLLTCTASPPATSCPRWSSSSAPRPGSPWRPPPGSRSSGRPNTPRSWTSPSAWRKPRARAEGCEELVTLKEATGVRRVLGRCCATAPAAACTPRSWRSARAPWAFWRA